MKPARIEGDVGDRMVLAGLDRQLPARVVGEAAVMVDADRPDFGCIADRIVDAAASAAIAQTRRSRWVKPQLPGSWLSKAASSMSITAPSSAIAARPCAGRPATPWSNVSIRVPSAPMRWIRPVSRSEAKNWRLGLVEGDVADAGSAVAVDRRKQRNGAADAVDLPDGAGTAAIALGELPVHEGGAGRAAPLPLGSAVGVLVRRDDPDSVQRGRRRIEVRHAVETPPLRTPSS